MEKHNEQQTNKQTSRSEPPSKAPSPAPVRHRLSSKQIAFFKKVFCANLPLSETLTDLNIRLSTFDRWLTKPLFLERLAQHINHYHFETRMELARNAPQAVSGLNFLSEKSLRHKEVRQACNDLLNLHSKLSTNVAEASCFGKPRSASSPKQPRQFSQTHADASPLTPPPSGPAKAKKGEVLDNNGEVLDKFGKVLDKFGVVLDNNGVIKDKQSSTKTTKNSVYDAENKENKKFPRLAFSK